MSNALPSGGAPVLIPHWEWRTFATSGDCVRTLEDLGTRLGTSDRREISLICTTSSHDVTIRDGRMALKWRKQVRPEGLERWDSVLDFTFPCGRETLQRLFEAWDIPSPGFSQPLYTMQTFLEEIVHNHPGLRMVTVEKYAESYSLEGTRCEWTRLVANQTHCECLCIEHEDPGLILQVVRCLGLQARPHASYPTGLKAALQLDTQH
ncbi:MAG: hypothetical protein LWW79_06320 [Holophagaceae bacterium]|nr:hypothetical protein [Holophagaceae bacterium]